MPGSLEEAAGSRWEPAARLGRRLVWLVVPAALAAELGHGLLERLARSLGGHLVHAVLLLGAVVAFGVYAAVDARRRGRPAPGRVRR